MERKGRHVALEHSSSLVSSSTRAFDDKEASNEAMAANIAASRAKGLLSFEPRGAWDQRSSGASLARVIDWSDWRQRSYFLWSGESQSSYRPFNFA